MNQNKAMFGISVFKRSITKHVIAELIKYMHDNYEESMVILVDEPEEHNWLLRGRDSRKHALEVARKTGDLRVNSVHKALRRHRVTIPVHKWELFSEDTGYKQNVSAICEYYLSNPSFRSNVLEKLHEYLGKYIKQSEMRLGRKLRQGELDEAAHFLLDEIAGLAHLHFHLGYNVDIYPDKNNTLIDDLFYGRSYHDLAKQLDVNPNSYRFIYRPTQVS